MISQRIQRVNDLLIIIYVFEATVSLLPRDNIPRLLFLLLAKLALHCFLSDIFQIDSG